MASLTRILAALHSELGPKFKSNEFDYRKTAREYRKDLGGGDLVAVGVDLISRARGPTYSASISAHARFAELESVYAKHNPLRDVQSYTLSVNALNLFSESAAIGSYDLSSEGAVQDFAGLLWGAIEADVLPFLETYGSREQLVLNLREEDYADWITSDREVRFSVLLSDCALRGDESGFDHYAEEWLDYCKRPHAVALAPIAEATVAGIRGEYFVGLSD